MKVDVNLNSIPALTEYVENTLTEAGAPMKAIIKMNIALDEMFSNVVKFSGASYAEVTCKAQNSTAYLILEDDGTKYNPLDRQDPDITLSTEDRNIGGLGIFVVKKSMTEMNYDYKDGRNILTLGLAY